MIKTSYATWGAVIPMLILTWYFSGMMDESLYKDLPSGGARLNLTPSARVPLRTTIHLPS